MHQAAFWTAEEVDLTNDIRDWNNLSDNEQYFVKNVYRFSRLPMVLLMKTWQKTFYREVQYPEAKFFYGFQLMMENIHSLMYSLLIDTYISNEEEKNLCFMRIGQLPAVQKKANGLWIGLRKHLSKKDWLRLLRLKVSSSQVHSVQFFG